MGPVHSGFLDRAFGMSSHLALQALLGAPAGFATLLGIGLLIYRRRIRHRCGGYHSE